jgi:hypothetical protein
MKIEVSNGELLDKYSILKIKSIKISDELKLNNVRIELESLQPFVEKLLVNSQLVELNEELFKVNMCLWDIEDSLRKKESIKQYDDGFIMLARSVYYNNDHRAKIKKNINELTNSRLVEEKSYNSY